MSLDVMEYADESAAQEAMDRAEIYGALIPGDTSSTLMVMPSISDISPLDLALPVEHAEQAVAMVVVPPGAI